jgi:hypothetical protein
MRLIFALLLLSFLTGTASARDETKRVPPAVTHPDRQQPSKLPPLPSGVIEVSWNDFFVLPVGQGGLQLTPKIKSLDGKRVRLFGYMVRREDPLPGVLLLTPSPISVEEHESGLADLPPQTVRVLLPYAATEQIPYTPRPLLLTGTLSVGRREEPGESDSGAVSWFRLTLDTPEKEKRQQRRTR